MIDEISGWRERLARLVDTEWLYSRHWPQDLAAALPKIEKDIDDELLRARRRVSNLERARSIASHLERIANPIYLDGQQK